MTELEVAREAARIGGDIIAQKYHVGSAIRDKGVGNLVSDADLESEQAIVAFLNRECPGHAILAEEEHADQAVAEHLWIVDPLDGTNNFAHGIPHFAVSIAYYRHGEPVCGVIWNPIRDDWYEAVRGGGARHNGAEASVAGHQRLHETLIGVGFYYDRGAMMEATLRCLADLFRENIHGIRRFGTASLDLCHVGVGYYGGFFEYELSPWDFAAGALFVEEAGGRVTTTSGAPLPLAKSTLLASNGHLHDAILPIVRGHQV